MKDFIKAMKALSDPNRVKIIKMLEQKKYLCVCEIQAAIGLAQPTISKHLKQLEDAGLVESFKDKQWVNYRLLKNSTNPYVKKLLKTMQGWLNDTKELIELKKKLPMINRADICSAGSNKTNAQK